MKRADGQPSLYECFLRQVVGQGGITVSQVEEEPSQAVLESHHQPRESLAVVGGHAEGPEVSSLRIC